MSVRDLLLRRRLVVPTDLSSADMKAGMMMIDYMIKKIGDPVATKPINVQAVVDQIYRQVRDEDNRVPLVDLPNLPKPLPPFNACWLECELLKTPLFGIGALVVKEHIAKARMLNDPTLNQMIAAERTEWAMICMIFITAMDGSDRVRHFGTFYYTCDKAGESIDGYMTATSVPGRDDGDPAVAQMIEEFGQIVALVILRTFGAINLEHGLAGGENGWYKVLVPGMSVGNAHAET